MVTAPNTPSAGPTTWKGSQVLILGVVCLCFGLAIGYLFRGSQPVPVKPVAQMPAGMGGGQMPSLDQMKHMAEKKAEPLLEKLKTDPKNSDLLLQVGNIYKATHQFKEAAGYYDQALKVDPKNTVARTEMASCLYYTGDADGAITQLQRALEYKPGDANSLFNLGMIRLRGKQDTKGALEAWQTLLKSNPELSAERKAQVQKLIADAKTQGKS